MESKYDLQLEGNLKPLGFKKKWLDDKSGYWLEKSFKYKDLKMNIIVESDRKLAILRVNVGTYSLGKLKMNQYYDDVLKFKCDLKTIKQILKKYK